MRSRLLQQQGMALVLAVVALAAIGGGAATVMELTSSNVRTSGYSAAKTHARTAAEAGIDQAMAILGAPNTVALDPTVLPARTMSFGPATVTYSGNLPPNSSTWTITSTAVEPNPARPGANVSYTLTATTLILSSSTATYNAHSYDYIMSTATGTPGGCDMTIGEGNQVGAPVTVAARLYVFGNLCVGGSSGGVGTITGAPLEVKGKVTVVNSSSGVGRSGAGNAIAGAHIAGGCSYNGTLHANCSNGNGTDRVWSSPMDATVDQVTAPVADHATWYNNAAPGPKHACTATSGTVPVWDGDATKNNSVVAIFNLTPAASYSCTSTVAGSPTGLLDWNAGTKTLTVSGTMYIDGSATATNATITQYNGAAVLYLSGTFKMDQSKLCGAISGSNCDWVNWNPNTEMLGIVAAGSGGQNPAGYSIYLNDSQFQGALFGNAKIRLEGLTGTAGPIIGSSIDIGYNVESGGSTAGFALVTKVPVGLPGVPNSHAAPQPPTYGTG